MRDARRSEKVVRVDKGKCSDRRDAGKERAGGYGWVKLPVGQRQLIKRT